MGLQPDRGRPRRPDAQQARLDPRPQVEPDRAHVAQHLFRRLLEQDQQRLLTALAGRIHHVRAERGLARARGPAHHEGRPAEHAAAQHVVEAGDARRDPLLGGLVVERDRRDRQHGEATRGDQEGVLVGAVRRPAVLDHAEAAGGDLRADPMVEHDHAVGDVLLDPVPGESTAVAPLSGQDDGDAPVLEPAHQPAELRPHDRVVAERAEQHLDGVQHDALGAHPPDRVVEDREERFEVEFSRRDDLGRIYPEREHREQATALKLVEIESERSHVEGDLGRRLLEGHEHAGLAVLAGAGDKEVQPEQRLARSRAARHQRHPAQGQAAPGDLVQPRNPGRRLLQTWTHRTVRQARQHRVIHALILPREKLLRPVRKVLKVPGNYAANRHAGSR